MKILWFSRHKPTEEQVAELQGWGVADLITHPTASELASLEIRSEEDAFSTLKRLLETLEALKCDAIAGVIPTPLRWAIGCLNWQAEMRGNCNMPGIPIYEAWNIMRPSPEGQRTFAHYRFIKTGEIFFSSQDVTSP